MASTYTQKLGLEKIGSGEQNNTWGNTTNTNWDIVEEAISGTLSIVLVAAGSSGTPNDIDIADGASSSGRNKDIRITDGGDLGADVYVRLTPNDAQAVKYITNALSGSRDLYLFQGTYNASNDVVIPAGGTAVCAFNGGGAGAVVTARIFITSFAATILDDSSAATARTTLGLVIGTNVQAFNSALTDISGLAKTDSNFIVGNGTNWVAESGVTVRTSLGLLIGTDVQAFNAALTDISGLAKTDSNFIVGNGTNWVAETGATVRTSLGIEIGTNVQAFSADLTAIAALAKTDSNFIVGNGSTWVAEIPATARTSLGLGTGDSPTFTRTTETSSATNPAASLIQKTGGTVFTSTYGSLLDLISNTAAADAVGMMFKGSGTHSWWGVKKATNNQVLTVNVTGTPIDAITATTAGLVSLRNGTGINEFSIDGTLAGNSDDAVPTEKAVKTAIATSKTWNEQIFTSSNTWTRPAGVSRIYYIVVAGGGGGGAVNTAKSGAGGGGGGQVKHSWLITVAGNITVTVGAGGNGGAAGNNSGSPGSDSSIAGSGFTTVTAKGGLGGQGANTAALTTAAGNQGGGSHAANFDDACGGGGGGAGGQGDDSPGGTSLNNTWFFSSDGYRGGTGIRSALGAGPGGPGIFGLGGGGGGGCESLRPFGPGMDGGGNGGKTAVGAPGTANTGGGGGGAGSGTVARAGGNGGSGVVKIYWADE